MTQPPFPPPQNLDAEAAILGAAMIDPVVVADCADLTPADFYSAFHRDVWESMRRLGASATDWVMIAADINKAAPGRYDDTLPLKLREIAHAVPSAYGYEGYASLIKEASRRRAIIDGCRAAAVEAYDGKRPSDAILGDILNLAGGVDGRSGGKLLSVYAAMAESASLSGGVQGVRCGVSAIDEATGGLVPGRLIVVGARPGQGKSSLIAQFATSAMESGAGVLFFSLEMSGPELAARAICAKARVDSSLYMRGRLNAEDRAKASAAAAALTGQMYIDETVNLDIQEIRLRALRHRARHGDLALIVVDYLGLAKAGDAAREQRYLQVGAVSQGLKQLAKELHVPVVAAHQLNRNAEHDGKQMDQRPKLSQLRESGSVEQDADQVLLIWPFQKDPRDGHMVDWQADPRPIEVALCKNRHGPQALIYLDFHRRWTTFSECGSLPKEIPEDEKRKLFPSFTEPSKGPDYE